MVENNHLTPSKFFYNWAVTIEDLTDNLGKKPSQKEVLEKLKISPQQFKNLIKFLKENYGIEKEADQNWAEFFHQISLFFAEDNQIENEEIAIDSQQPAQEQLENLITEKEAFENRKKEILEAIKTKIKDRLGLNPTEAEQFIQRLLIIQKNQLGKIIKKTTEKTFSSHDRENLVLEVLKKLVDKESKLPKFTEKIGLPNQIIEAISIPTLEDLNQKIKTIEDITAKLPQNYRGIPTSTAIAVEIISRLETIDEGLKETKKNILISQIPAEIDIKKRLINFRIPEERAENIAKKAIEEKKQTIKAKINTTLPEIKPEAKIKIISACLADDYQQAKKSLKKLKNVPETTKKKVFNEIIISNQFIADREAVADKIKNPSVKAKAVIPDSFIKKLNQHPQVVNTIAGLVVTRASQGVPKDKISFTITAPTAISMSANKMPVEKGEEKAIDQIISGLDNTTLKMIELKAKKITGQIETSILTQLKEQTQSYLGKQSFIKKPDGTYRVFDMSDKVSEKAISIMAEFWAKEPTQAGDNFFELKIKGEVPFSHTLKALPSGDPIEIMSHFNADQDAFMAAAIAAQMASIPPEKLQEQILAWQQFVAKVEKSDQPEIIHQDKLLATFQSWYGKEGVGEKVYSSQLYQTYHGIRQVFSPITNFVSKKIQPQIKNLFDITAVGKGIKAVWNKGKGFLKEKIFDPIKKWTFEKIGQKLAEKGVSVAVGKGVSAAIAAALGVSTGGVSLALMAGWEAVKAGVKLIKTGLKKIGIDPEKLAKKFNQAFGFGIATQINKFVDKIKIIPQGIRGFIKSFINVSEPITITIMGIPLIIFAVGITFVLLLFIQTSRHSQDMLTMAPPVTEQGGAGVPIEDFSDIEVVDIDIEECLELEGSAQRACIVTIVIQGCNATQGKVTEKNVGAVRGCFEKAMEKDENINNILSAHLNHIVNNFSYSANKYEVLQCVGYKIAVEPALPGCGDAKHYYPNGCGNCKAISASDVRPGDNAVWIKYTPTDPWGHIAIVIGVDKENNLVYLSQAWGGSGAVNFTKIPNFDPSGYIRCR